MSHSLPNDILSQLSSTIAVKTALHFPKERWKDLEHKAGAVAKEFGYADIKEFTSYLQSSSLTVDQIEILASHLTIGETYFWREPQSFEALEQKI
ncbi:MAG: chemotaxis protein CheR, partial [Ignavibacteria bacterium]|nr:chemotaxis protein CheR [Ignavibacteria bacterium]